MTRIEPTEFWPWAFSDFLSNTLRGVLAEFIVAKALGLDGTPRPGAWAPYDLRTPTGLKVEVKASAFLQAWGASGANSPIKFDIAPRDGRRPADTYVFCLLAAVDRVTADPLDTAQWRFIVAPTPLLDRHFGGQKSVTLGRLLSKGLQQVTFQDLADALPASLSEIK